MLRHLHVRAVSAHQCKNQQSSTQSADTLTFVSVLYYMRKLRSILCFWFSCQVYTWFLNDNSGLMLLSYFLNHFWKLIEIRWVFILQRQQFLEYFLSFKNFLRLVYSCFSGERWLLNMQSTAGQFFQNFLFFFLKGHKFYGPLETVFQNTLSKERYRSANLSHFFIAAYTSFPV